MVRCRPGIVSNAESGAIPDQRRTATLRFALHRIRETSLLQMRDQAAAGRSVPGPTGVLHTEVRINSAPQRLQA